MSQESLNILDRSFLLSECCNRPAYHLERELRQFEFACQLMQNAFSIIAGVHKPTRRVRKDERIGRSVRTLLLPEPQVFCQLFRQVHPTEASLVLTPRPNRAFVDGLDHFHSGFFVLEGVPAKGKELAWTQ